MPFKVPGSITKLNQLHQDLQQIFSNVIKDLEYELQSTQLPITINRDSLAERICKDLQNTYHVVSNNTDFANQQIENANTKLLQGLGNLSRLPLELRNLIYAEMVSSGSVAITAVSKIINMETATIVSTHGIFRTSLGFQHERTANRTLDAATSSKAAGVQNVEIRVNSKAGNGRRFSASLKELTQLFGATHTLIRRKRCRVELELAWDCWITVLDDLLTTLLGWLKSFTGFAEVVFLVATEARDRGMPVALENLDHWESEKLLAKQSIAMRFVERELVPALGNVVWREEERGMAAYFHPRID